MFISSAYERRLDQEKEEEQKFLGKPKPKLFKIGSIRNKRINYDKDEHFFASSDMPLNVRKIREEVCVMIDPDHLELRKKPWNSSVSVPKNPENEEDHQRKMIKIKLGFFDHKAPKIVQPIIYEGCEVRNNYQGWNVSTKVDKKEVQQRFDQITDKAKQLNRNKENLYLKNYKTIKQLQKDLMEKHRQTKYDEKEIRQQIREEYKFQNKDASKENVDSAVFRILNERKLLTKKQHIDDPSGCLYKPDLSKTLRQQIKFKYHHPGVWQTFSFPKQTKLNQIKEQLPKYFEKSIEDKPQPEIKMINAWSCCMNQNQNSRGCNEIKIDKLKWILTTFQKY